MMKKMKREVVVDDNKYGWCVSVGTLMVVADEEETCMYLLVSC